MVTEALLTEADIELEARRLLTAAWEAGIHARLLGGLAVAERAAPAVRAMFARKCGDIDLVITRRASGSLVGLMETNGYVEDVEFNAMNGRTRLVFADRGRSRDVDVFVEDFEMCHVVPLRLDEAERRGSRTLLLSDLMLTKLQIVRLTDKDVTDAVMLLMSYDVTGDDESAIDGGRIASLCARDWGLWRTTSENLGRIAAALDALDAPAGWLADAKRRLRTLGEQVEAEPKSTRWRVRARVGDRVRWYEEPDEK
ncbi:MAG TPA: hypothetical protein VIH85_15085 [Solirubrobacteraceae bacterium]|jgi:hypothetical protein